MPNRTDVVVSLQAGEGRIVHPGQDHAGQVVFVGQLLTGGGHQVLHLCGSGIEIYLVLIGDRLGQKGTGRVVLAVDGRPVPGVEAVDHPVQLDPLLGSRGGQVFEGIKQEKTALIPGNHGIGREGTGPVEGGGVGPGLKEDGGKPFLLGKGHDGVQLRLQFFGAQTVLGGEVPVFPGGHIEPPCAAGVKIGVLVAAHREKNPIEKVIEDGETGAAQHGQHQHQPHQDAGPAGTDPAGLAAVAPPGSGPAGGGGLPAAGGLGMELIGQRGFLLSAELTSPGGKRIQRSKSDWLYRGRARWGEGRRFKGS